MAGLERARERVDLQRAEHRARAADVIAVAVAEHQQVDVRLAARAQQRHEHALAGVALARVLRARVEEQHVLARAHDHRRALADVGGEEVEAAGRRQDRAAASAARVRAGRRAAWRARAPA